MQSFRESSFNHGIAIKQLVLLVLVVLAMTLSGAAQLARVGPVDSSSGFPQWYQDKNGLALDICVPNLAEYNSGLCLLLPGPPENLPPPPYVIPTNWPPEMFYFNATSNMNVNGGKAKLVISHEAGFGAGVPALGDQMVFSRIRFIVDIPSPGGAYKIISPYLVKDFPNVSPGKRGIAFTEDIGLVPGDFTVSMTKGKIFPYLRPSLTPGGAPLGYSVINGRSYISDSATPFPVTGSPLSPSSNIFRIEGPNIGGPGINFIQTNLFTLMGRVHTAPIPSPLTIDRATYVRDATKGWIDAFVTATPGVGKPDPVLSLSAGSIAPKDLSKKDSKFYGQLSLADPANLPAIVTVTNNSDTPPSVSTASLVDEVNIQKAEYDGSARTLTIKASSGDKQGAPVLIVDGVQAPNNRIDPSGFLTLENVLVPPTTITVRSSLGGIETATVSMQVPLISPAALTFPGQVQGTTSDSKIVTLTNSKGTTLTINSITIEGNNAAEFALANRCGPTLLTGETCSVNITFTPAVSGARSASLIVNSTDAGTPLVTIPLIGFGAELAAVTAPSPSGTLNSYIVPFIWSTGIGVSAYQLQVGSSAGASDLYDSGVITATSAVASPLPMNASAVFVRLQSQVNGVWFFNDYTYTAFTAIPLTVTAGNATRAYGAANPPFTGTIVGLQSGDNVTATYASATDANSAVGTYSIVPTLVDPNEALGNYAVTLLNGTLTVSRAPLNVTAASVTRAVGDPNPTFTGTITGLKNGDNITATYSSVATASSLVGTYPIVPALADSTNKLGNYAVTSVNGVLSVQNRPSTVSVSPSSGVGRSQLFQLTYSDPAGFAAITQTQTIFSAVQSYGAGCAVLYEASTSSIQMKDDSGLNWSAAAKLGVAGVLQNSQCSVDVGASSAAGVGKNLTLSYAVTFKPAYVGSKNIYMYAINKYGLNSGWSVRGTWTLTSTPSTVSVTPSTGTGTIQLFQLKYSDPAGFASISQTQTIISAVQTYGTSCAVSYTASTGSLQLKDDSGLNWSAAAKLGVPGVLQNTQCSIDAGTSSAVGAGNNLTLSLAVSLKPAYAGTKNIYMYTVNKFGINSGWSSRGTWTVPSNPPTAVSVLPSTGSGASQLFQLTHSDPAGFAAISSTQTILSSVRTYGTSCAVLYTASTGSLQIKEDSGVNWSAAAKLGVAGVLQNTQCSIDAGASSATGAGNNLTLSYAVTFKPAYAGAKNTYSYAANKFGLNSGWQTLGTWTVPAAAPSVLSVSPNTGTGASQLFLLSYSDPAGFAAISQTQTIISSVRSYTAGCAVYYTASTQSIQIKDDSGLNLSAAAKLGVAGVLQNSQCSIDVGSSSVAGAGTNLTLSYAITFKPAYVGTKNVYSYAANKFALNSGWQTLGTWIP